MKKIEFLWTGLRKRDEIAYKLYVKEIHHQMNMLSLNANDNIMSIACLEAASNLFVNYYPENYRTERTLRRTRYHDMLEKLAIKRALRLFNLVGSDWSANVRLTSGTSANFIVFMALAGLGGKIMGIKDDMGGHHSFTFLADWHQNTFQEKVFDPLSYRIKETGKIDYEAIKNAAIQHKPKIIIAGGYAISCDINFKKIKKIAESVNAILLGDISHPSELISHGLMNNPFDYCDVVTTVMQKTMGGPRAGIIYFKKIYEKKINDAQIVLCGNAHTHIIFQVAVALKEARSRSHKELCKRIQENANLLQRMLKVCGFTVLKTESHMILIDMESEIKAYNFEVVADYLNISLDRVSLATHPCVYKPTGIRIGTTGITRRGIQKKELEEIAEILNEIRSFVEKDLINKESIAQSVLFVEKDKECNMRISRKEELNKKGRLTELKKKIGILVRKHPIPYFIPMNKKRYRRLYEKYEKEKFS